MSTQSQDSEAGAQQVDVAIVGGGLVGASLACALTSIDLRCALIEASPPGSDDQPSYDERTVALTWSSRQIFTGIGVWDAIAEREATPITAIHVNDRGHFGMARLSASDVGTSALGYVVPHRVLGQVFFEHIERSPGLTLMCPATVQSVEPGESCARVTTSQGSLDARLVVIADGGRSGIAESLGMRSSGREYAQRAIIATVTPDRDPDGLAYERFTSSGPLALLPAANASYVLAWTVDADHARSLVDCSDTQFLDELQRTFGRRAGRFVRTSTRRSYPLKLETVANPIAARAVAIGNAAHTVHPVAGQGFNLGLRDVAALADAICDATAAGKDIGNRHVLGRYASARRRDTRSVSWITDGLVRSFANNSIPLAVARNTGLSMINLLPPVRRALLRQTMGLNAPASRLGLGQPLNLDSSDAS